VIALQASCLAIVALWLAAALAHDARPVRLAAQALALGAAAWLAEDTCIRFYGFYAYDPGWFLFLDRVPVTVLCIWPAVILSDRALVEALWPDAGWARPLAVGALVAADAALIEPVSVASGLWSWTEPGLFGVPPVAVLGWGCLGGLAAALLDLAESRRRAWLLLVPLALPLGVHAAVLAAWWGLLRWVSVPLPGTPAAAVAWAATLVLVAAAIRARRHLPAWQAVARVPPGLFFLVLLVLHGRGRPDLVAWALAFTPPHLALLSRSFRRDDPPVRA
jgi:hypothetical protein